MKKIFKRGFTLIELLAVVVILAIILVMAVPQVLSTINESKVSTFEDSAKIVQEHVMALKVSGSLTLTDNVKRCISTDEAKMLDLSTTDYDIGYDDVNDTTCSTMLAVSDTVVVTLVPKTTGKFADVEQSVYPIVPTPDVCFVFNSTTKTITGYNHTNPICLKDVVIPETIGGVPVLIIGNTSFFNKSLTSIIIPNSVTTIGIQAFKLNQLTYLKIGTGVKTIGQHAFSSNKLENIDLPKSLTSIGGFSFYNNLLTNVTIPSSVIIIGEGSFYGNQLISVIIENGVQTIGFHAFSHNQISNLSIPNSVITIDGYAFYSNQLPYVTIPNSVTTIGEFAFRDNKITNLVNSNSINSIGMGVFNNNLLPDNQAFIYARNTDGSINTNKIISYGGLKKDNIIIPSGVTTLGDSAFIDSLINSVIIPNGVTNIESYAFYKNQLTSITIPNTVTTLGDAIFNNNLLADNQAFIYARNVDGSINNSTIVSYGGIKKDNIIIPSGVITLGYSSFTDNSITSITIPNSVTTIGEAAFYNNLLTNIILPPAITNIPDYAFYMNNLTSILIPNSVRSIGANSFQYNNITQGNARIDSAVGTVTIGVEAFNNNGASQTTTITPTYLR